MAIVYGTGSYTIKRFTPIELGLMTSDFDGYEFQIVKRYAHLYWIPIFSLGTLYAVSKYGSSDKYEANEGIKSLMQQHHVPFWKHLGAFALPLIAILGFTIYNINEKAENARSEQLYQTKMAESTQAMADTAALRPSANQLISLINCLEKSEAEKIGAIKKIDTAQSKVFSLLIKCMATERDTTIPYTRENTFINTPDIDFNSETLQSKLEENSIIERYRRPLYSHNLTDMSVLNWYYSGFKETPTSNDAYRVDNINRINEHLGKIKYVVNIRYTGFARPSIDVEQERFNSGYILSKVFVYEVGTNKLVEKYDFLAYNSESISYRSRQGQSISDEDMNSRLVSDLESHVYHELMVSLRLTKGEYKSNTNLIF